MNTFMVRLGALAAALVFVWVMGGHAAHAAFGPTTYQVTSAQSSGPPYPAVNSIVADVLNQLDPQSPPIRTEILETTLEAFTPTDPCRLLATAGDPGVPGETMRFSAGQSAMPTRSASRT